MVSGSAMANTSSLRDPTQGKAFYAFLSEFLLCRLHQSRTKVSVDAPPLIVSRGCAGCGDEVSAITSEIICVDSSAPFAHKNKQ